jgi:hypothetical protein
MKKLFRLKHPRRQSSPQDFKPSPTVRQITVILPLPSKIAKMHVLVFILAIFPGADRGQLESPSGAGRDYLVRLRASAIKRE